MPTYEYHCEGCRKSYDLRESFSAESQHTCHKCGKGTAKRVLHAPRVLFKGSGFYVTDSKSSSSSYSESTSSSSSSDSDSGSDAPADTGSPSGGDTAGGKVESEAAG